MRMQFHIMRGAGFPIASYMQLCLSDNLLLWLNMPARPVDGYQRKLHTHAPYCSLKTLLLAHIF